jgi:NOL1/NOP2/sun family putative RNA methylase
MTNPTPENYFSEYSEFVPDFEAFCEKLCDPLPLHLRINTLKATVTETRLRLERCGWPLVQEKSIPAVFRAKNITQPGHILEFSLGHLHSQALSSVLAVLALDPKPVDVVLDLCAAPGSKTSFIAQLMENQGTIVANEKNPNRLIPLHANLKRLGVTNTITVRNAGQHFPKRFAFDRILVDVPCSAEGTLRAGPKGTFRWPTRPGEKLPRLQRDLLLRGFDLLKPGGTLVYSTCTYNPEENESAIQFLLQNRQAKIKPISLDLPHSPGLGQWKETTYDPSVRQCWRLYPHQLDTVGFFLARVGKRV